MDSSGFLKFSNHLDASRKRSIKYQEIKIHLFNGAIFVISELFLQLTQELNQRHN